MQLPRVDGEEHKQSTPGLIRTSLVRNQHGKACAQSPAMGHQGKRNKASSKAGSAVSGKLSSIIGRTSSLYFLRNPGDGRRTRFNIRHQTSRSSSAHLNYTVTHIGISSEYVHEGKCGFGMSNTTKQSSFRY